MMVEINKMENNHVKINKGIIPQMEGMGFIYQLIPLYPKNYKHVCKQNTC